MAAATGHIKVEERKKGCVWVASLRLSDGTRSRTTLGNAWVRDSGRVTTRGAVSWRAAHGPKPDDTFLTPKEAAAELERLLSIERAKPAGKRRIAGKRFGEACDLYLRQRAGRGGVAATTLRNYAVITGKLKSEFGEQTPLRQLNAARLARFQDDLLAVGPGRRELSRQTVRNRMLVLRGVLDCAREAGWIGTSPMADVKIVTQPGAEPDFNVLEPAQVEAVAHWMTVIDVADEPLMRNGKVDAHALEVMLERRRLWADMGVGLSRRRG